MSGKVALILFAVHVTLLFFPPLPPVTRGSLWSHGLVLGILIAAAFAIANGSRQILSRWSGRSPHRRLTSTVAAAAGLALVGALIYWLAPGLFVRFSAEEGVWEPLSTLAYLGGAILLFKVAGSQTETTERRHLLFIGSFFLFLFLEEINYLEIVGGLLPRFDEIYVGAVHNIVDLWAHEVISSRLLALLAILGAALATVIWRFGFLQPVAILRDLRYPRFLFVGFGFTLIVIALAIEARLIEWRHGVQRPEELIELIASICLLAFALDLAGAAEIRRKVSGR